MVLTRIDSGRTELTSRFFDKPPSVREQMISGANLWPGEMASVETNQLIDRLLGHLLRVFPLTKFDSSYKIHLSRTLFMLHTCSTLPG